MDIYNIDSLLGDIVYGYNTLIILKYFSNLLIIINLLITNNLFTTNNLLIIYILTI